MRAVGKGFISACVLALSYLFFPLGKAHADRYLTDNIKVQKDDKLVAFPDAEPFVDNGSRLQVPVRFVSDVLGLKVDWQLADGQVKVQLSKQGTQIRLTTGEKTAVVNGKTLTLETPPLFSQGRVFVPLRFLTDILQIRIQWDDRDQIAILDMDGRYHAPAWYAPRLSNPIDFVASAYTVQENSKWGGLDAMGNPVKLGTVSVDPSVIPLGTKVWITGYSYSGLPQGGLMATASDTGSAIKGHRIDIYLPCSREQALNFGKQHVQLSIVK